MELSMAPPPIPVNEPGERTSAGLCSGKAALRSVETLGYINWLESQPIRL
jgi:hypothetical protein